MHAWWYHWYLCIKTAAGTDCLTGHVRLQQHARHVRQPATSCPCVAMCTSKCTSANCKHHSHRLATVCRHKLNNKRSWWSHPYCLATPPMHLVAMPSRKMSLCFFARVRASSQHCTFLPEFTEPPIGRHEVTSSAVRSRNHSCHFCSQAQKAHFDMPQIISSNQKSL